MKTSILTIALIAALVVLAGCGQKQETNDATKTFIGGTEGLAMSFEPGFPPEEAFDSSNSPFDIDIKMKNNGEYTVKAANVEARIVGPYAPDFGKTEADFVKVGSEDITAMTKSTEGQVMEGGETHIQFTGLNYKQTLSGNELFNYRADVCYTYGTEAVTRICVLKDLLRTTESNICIVNEDKEVKNSGAPVQITKVTESRYGTQDIGITLDIANIGTGEIFQRTKKCDATQLRDKNKVWVEIDTGLADVATCSGLKDESGNIANGNKGYVTLNPETKQTRITCVQKAVSQQDFTKTINFKLEYDYYQTMPWNLLIKHLS
jgi:hypothetical protein